MSEDSIMVPASDADVGRMANIQAMRMMQDSQSVMQRSLERMSESVQTIATDIAVLKNQDHQASINAAQEAFRVALEASNRRIEALATQHHEDNLRRDTRLEQLLASSLADRNALWIANTERKSEIKNLADRIIPVFSAVTAAVAVVVAIIIEKVLK